MSNLEAKDRELANGVYRNAEASSDEYVPGHGDKQLTKDWSDGEERKLVFKLDMIVTAILTLCFFCMQMDRGNIGTTLNTNFFKDIGIDQATYNVGQQLLYLGIVLFELPSNLVLYRVGPRAWLGGQIIIWGLIETFQCFQNSAASFQATRFLLGAAEGGFIPAALYCLSLWYKRDETSKRFTIFYFGNLVSQGATSLLSYGIFRMDGISVLHNWQWMFILEGIFTVLCGVVLILFLPSSPTNPYPLTRLSYFTAREREIMVQRVLLDDPSKEKTTHYITLKQIATTFADIRIWPHLIISMCGIACVSNFLQYAPQLVNTFGYSKLEANAYVSIGPFLQIPVSLALAFIADKARLRSVAIFIAFLFLWGFVIGDYVLHNPMNEHHKQFALLTVTLAFSSVWQPINGSWLSINCNSPAERSVTLAIFVAATNVGGIWGSQLFQASDKPKGYPVGWAAIVGIETLALVMVFLTTCYYLYLNKRNAKWNKEGLEIVNGKRVKFWL